MFSSSLRPILRRIYHRLPFTQNVKWRVRQKLIPWLNIIEKASSIADLSRNVATTVYKELSGKNYFLPDSGCETALHRILFDLSEHSKLHGVASHWIALPFISTGGAEKVSLNLCLALRELQPERSIVLLVTDRKQVVRPTAIPEWVALVNFDDYLYTDFSYSRKQALLRDLLLAVKPQCFHNINSEVAWHLILTEGNRLKKGISLFASIFAFQFAPDGQTKIGYAAYYLEKSMPFLTGLISDNQRFVDDAAIEYRFNSKTKARIHVLYQPIISPTDSDNTVPKYQVQTTNERPQILWAGRLDAEKQVDLFLDVVRRCTFADFRVFGQVVLDEGKNLPSLSNLSYEGPFTSPKQWQEHFNFNAFLFTSKWEGMPNTILEAGALRIPIIAPTVGGIGELISEETGYPLPERPSVSDYEKALRSVIDDPDLAQTKAARLHQVLSKQHSWQSFVNNVATLPGYESEARLTSEIDPLIRISNSPLVSVIVPCFNQGRYLYECVSSALLSCNASLEIIIIDDGSTDSRTAHYLREVEALAPSVVRLHYKTNGGLSSARNAGLELARGEFFQFLDADDLLAPNKIDIQLAQFSLNKKIDVSVCNYLLCDETRSHFSKPDEAIAGFDLSIEDFLYRWERGFCIPIHCGLFRRRALDTIRFDTHARAKEDWLFWTTITLSKTSFGYIHTHGVFYRQHDSSMRKSYLNMGKSWLQAGLKIETMLDGKYPIFFESFTSWFEQYYRGNPSYKAEVKAINDATASVKAKTIAPENSLDFTSSTLEINPVKLIDELSGVLIEQRVPLISVIIPIYNHYDYLEECFGSLAKQKKIRFEIVCVDDGSSDSRVTSLMRALHGKFDHLKVIIQATNRGISQTQNAAVAAASGEFVAFLDCDDALEHNALNLIQDQIIANPKVDYFFTDRHDIDTSGKLVRTARYGGYGNLHYEGNEKIQSDLLDGMVASHLKVIRRSTYLAVGGCEEEFSGIQDWALALKIAEIKSMHYINQPIYRHRVHHLSITRSDSVAQFRKSNVLRRRFATRWLRANEFEKGASVVKIWEKKDFPLSLDQLKTAWKQQIKCVAFISGALEISHLNFLREFNSYFDEIRWSDPVIPASLIGYLWSDSILLQDR